MKNWNMIIDVAECTNCNLCTLATMDEYIGNDWPGYAAQMPKHGHRWIDILQRERGQQPMIDVAYVPTMCNHCDDAPCIAAARDGAFRESEAAKRSACRRVPRSVRLVWVGCPSSSRPTKTRISKTPGVRSRIVAIARG